ncbi:hypothetical protein N7516_009460 [Penicillium verrucosum]|uniref:uncharacterized protein n=1 Tax=Penicillium verrucosum TaxID=60171 RepID=UPI002544D90E|nr:uncharacterized protein N7516_009460 [Penicillium verrucosum]KAJ5927687.1 hypothetical protein N7516_009460 [Penicillium verrucosum]
MQPVRHTLGGLLLEQGRVEEAETLFKEDLGFALDYPRQFSSHTSASPSPSTYHNNNYLKIARYAASATPSTHPYNVNPRLFDILTGHIAQPAPEDPALAEWLRQSRHLLPYLHATVHASLKPYIDTAPNAPAAYQSLYKAFAVRTYNIGFDKFHKWTTLKYDNATTPQQFVIKWRTAYAELVEACGHSHVSNTAQYFFFLTAVGVNPATHQWLNILRPPNNDTSEQVLIEAFSGFVISENRRLATHPNFTSDPVFYDANATYNQGNKLGKKLRHFCIFHQRKTAHTSEECFQNPANPKSAHAVNTPANTTTNKPTTANAPSNPIVRYNNLFDN